MADFFFDEQGFKQWLMGLEPGARIPNPRPPTRPAAVDGPISVEAIRNVTAPQMPVRGVAPNPSAPTLAPGRPVAEIRTGIAPGSFFHGTDPRTALDLAIAHTNRVGLMVSQDPSLALGQGGRGALVEINPEVVQAQPVRTKPGSLFVEAMTGRPPELEIREAPREPGNFVRSITLDPPKGRLTRAEVASRRLLAQALQTRGWQMETLPDGRQRWTPAAAKPPATMSPEGSGTSVLSNEELARRETFYKFDRSGRPTFLGRQPDATLRPGEAIVAVGPQGQARVVNSLNAGSDAEVLKRLAPRLAKLPRLPVGSMGGTTLRAVGPIGFFLGLPGQIHLLNQFQRDPFFLRGLDVPLS